MLSILLDYGVVFFPLAIAVLSVLVSIRLAKSESHRGWWWLIITIGVVCSVATGYQQKLFRDAHRAELKAQNDSVNRLRTDMDGRLDGILLTLLQNKQAAPNVVAKVIKQAVKPPMLSFTGLPNDILRSMGSSVAVRIRDLHRAWVQEDSNLSNIYRDKAMFAKRSEEERQHILDEGKFARAQREDRYDSELKDTMIIANSLREDILHRLVSYQRYKMTQQDDVETASFARGAKGDIKNLDARDASEYLRQLAEKLAM